MIRLALTLGSSLLLSSLVAAQTPGKSEAKAEAKATGNQTVTHRVEVVNGKVIVDEKTVNGKRVDGKKGPAAGKGGVTPPPVMDPKEMLRRMREKMGTGFPPGVGSDSKTSKSSHSHKVVVKNGEVIVDEEIKDGKPVNKNKKKPAPKNTGKKSQGTPGLGRDRLKKRAKPAARQPGK